MSLTQAKTRLTADKGKIRICFHIQELHPNLDSASDLQSKNDGPCTLCGRRLASDIIQNEISLCPACNRHLEALSDDSIKSCINHWLRQCRPFEPSRACRVTRLAS